MPFFSVTPDPQQVRYFDGASRLRPRDPAKVCGAKTPNGPCQQWKGFKTSHPGTGRCNRHGGSTPNQTKAADQEIVETRMRTYGAPVEMDPLTAILQEVARTAGHVAWLDAKIAGLTDKGGRRSGDIIEDTMFGKKPSVWIKIYQDERAHLTRVSKVALDNGVAEKMLDVIRQNGRALGEFVAAVLHDPDLGLTSDQLKTASGVVQRHMQKALTS
jgi:hypothetical protein